MESLDCVCAADIPRRANDFEGFRGADDEDEEPRRRHGFGYW